MIIQEPHPSDPSSSTHTTYRLKRGTKLADIPSRSSSAVPSLSKLNGPFQLSEYLALRVRHDPHDVAGLVDLPKGDTESGGKAPEQDMWIYEHLRRIPIDLTTLLSLLLPICSRTSCPEMKADQWLYFCSAHAETAECCAIDHILHTVDVTTATVTSTRQFPSRMSIPSESLKHFPSLFRRISRVFSHAYFHHREAFSLAEAETSLYARFVGLCERYGIVGEHLLVIPHKALAPSTEQEDEKEDEEEEEEEDDDEGSDEDEEDEDEIEYISDTTKRGRGDQAGKGEKRTRSLDRHGPPSSTEEPIKPKLLQRSDTVVPTPENPAREISPGKEDPFKASPRLSSRPRPISGKGTLGRGKQGRGTMLWNSDMSAMGDIPIGPELTRSESNQTAILIEEDEPAVQSVAEDLKDVDKAESGESKVQDEDELPVPKDEIELLEEEGIIPPAPTVSPLPPPQPATKEHLPAETKDKEVGEDDSNASSAVGTEEDEPSAKEVEDEPVLSNGADTSLSTKDGKDDKDDDKVAEEEKSKDGDDVETGRSKDAKALNGEQEE